MASVRQGGIRRLGVRWLLPFMCIFVFPLAITAVRIQYRERMARIEALERGLSERLADEAYLQVSIERACDYAAVQREARDRWKMKVAGRDQRYIFAPAPSVQVAERTEREVAGGSVVRRAERLFRTGVAQAQSATDEGTVRAR
jgi:cell division protein FtsL